MTLAAASLDMTMEIASLNLLAGWIGMVAGVISGAVIGFSFHKKEWLGGYSSFRRRITRLGHISFWGLGFINVMFALSVKVVELPIMSMRVASLGFILGSVTMPLCCFLTAWRESFRFLFPVPVICVLLGIVSFLMGWATK